MFDSVPRCFMKNFMLKYIVFPLINHVIEIEKYFFRKFSLQDFGQLCCTFWDHIVILRETVVIRCILFTGQRNDDFPVS